MSVKILDIDFGGTTNDNEEVPDWTPERNSPQSIVHPDPEWRGHLERQPFPGCLDTLRLLRREGGFAPIGVVSKVIMKPLVQAKVRQWYAYHGFNEVIPQELICFCGAWEEKLPICLSRGTTHFIDNNLKPLAPMVGHIPHLFLFCPPNAEKHQDENRTLWHLVGSGAVTLVHSWAEFGEVVLGATS